MEKSMVGLSLIVILGYSVAVSACSQTATERRAAKPNISERITRDAITGDVKDVGKNYVSIRENSGETTKVRVNDSTKMDPLTEGDHVKAFVTDDGYASTIQRTPR